MQLFKQLPTGNAEIFPLATTMASKVAIIFLASLWLAGCASTRPSVTQPTPVGAIHERDLRATCFPPAQWRTRPVAPDPQAKQQVWFSPTGDTAYGVVCISMPIPAGKELALQGFLSVMQQREGEVDLISKQHDRAAHALRFVAQMPDYEMRGKLVVQGFSGWVMFASTLRSRPVRCDELELAESAREATRPD